MSNTYNFKTETKRLLDLMINSIYTNKEIFLRELISNASDAIDKHHFATLTNQDILPLDYEITVETDSVLRTITITDNGVGFTYDQLNDHLGTIAKSGSKEFVETMNEEDSDKVDIIGQFGVGFYSAFMVADYISVETKSPFSNVGYLFKSEGLDTYSIEECDKTLDGTKITLHLRENTEDVVYDEYLDEYQIKSLIKKYSDYVRYPIKTWVSSFSGEGEDRVESKTLDTINSMVPIWKKRKSEVTEDELNDFYKQKFMDFMDPLTSIHVSVEGMITYNALLFIPKKPPYNLYSEKYERGLSLYTKGVFILDKCEQLMPEYLRFVKGLVDSSDLALNISREMLQNDKTLTKIASNLEKKVLSELKGILVDEREKYNEFFADFGINLKYGAYENFGSKKEQLQDLLLFKSFNNEDYITLSEYVSNMKEGQTEIYYASGHTKSSIKALPAMDLLKKQGYDVLIFEDDIDEFLIQVLKTYQEFNFKSINQGDLNLISEEDSKKIEELNTEKKDLILALKEALKDDVSDVVLSKRLSESAVCLVSKDGVSFEMEKVLKAQQDSSVKAEQVLEINPNHDIFKFLESAYNKDASSINKYATLLYSQALIIEGIPLKDNIEFANLMCELMINSNK